MPSSPYTPAPPQQVAYSPPASVRQFTPSPIQSSLPLPPVPQPLPPVPQSLPAVQQVATPPKHAIPQSAKKKVFCPAAIELVDESITLFTRLPINAWATYYATTLPMCIGLILFWHDMRTGENANSRIYVEALVLALLYCLMKVGHAAFCSQVFHRLASLEDAPWTFERIVHVAVIQIIFAGSFFIFYPISFTLLMGIPVFWFNSFYHNVSLIGSEAKSTLGSTFRESAQIATLWSGKNFFGFVYQLVLGTVVLINLLILGILVPMLLKYFLNVETSFAQSPEAYEHSSAPLLTIIVCYLILNPINKTFHVLRCFYAKSRSSGIDMMAALRIRKSIVLTVVLAIAMAATSGSAWAQSTDSSPSPASSSSSANASDSDDSSQDNKPTVAKTPKTSPTAQKLNDAINNTLGQKDYKWRTANSDEDPILRSINSVFKLYNGITNFFEKAIHDMFNTRGNSPQSNNSGLPAVQVVMKLVLVGAAILVIVAVVYAISKWRSPQLVSAPLPALPIRKIDLNEENITADALPEDSWLVLARELISKGEFRLALRAFYLASLATMASREWVMLSRGKSNRDYLREFGRRLRTKEAPVTYFSQTMDLFEASWYGDHSVTDQTLAQVEKNHQLLRQHAA